MKKCEDCTFCITTDEGYSNYTVENTRVECALMLNPFCPFDRFYGEDPKMYYATKCDWYSEGACVHCGVEDDGPYSEDDKLIMFIFSEIHGPWN